MQINIENFGKIKKANVCCSGLTLLTGNNDNGKSTIGKLLFSVIETISIYQDYSAKKFEIEKYTQSEFFAFSTKIYEFLKNKKKDLSPEDSKIYRSDVYDILDNFEKYKSEISNYLHENREEYDKIIVYVNSFSELKKRYQSDFDKFDIALQDILIAEFKQQFNKEKSKIEISNGKSMLSFTFDKEGNAQSDKSYDLDYLIAKFYNKVFFIETPWVLEWYKLLKDDSYSYLDYFLKRDETGKIKSDSKKTVNSSLHSKEIAKSIYDCLEKQEMILSKQEFITSILEKIKSIVDGDFVYNKETKTLKFIRDEKSFDISNIASGIKSFGILDTLLKGGVFDEKTILILDEPEAHLHPIWQVKYAEFIVQLILNGFNILIASHSETFVDAVRQACINNKIWETNKVNVYHTIPNNDDKTVEIKNVKELDEKESIIYKSFYKSNEMIDEMN